MPTPLPSPSTDQIAAELLVIGDQVDQLRARVGGLAEPFLGTDREDLVAAVHEAERQLHMATRALQRALKSAS